MALPGLSSLGSLLGGGGTQTTITNTIGFGANVSPVLSITVQGESGLDTDGSVGADAQSAVVPTQDNTPQSVGGGEGGGVLGAIGGLFGGGGDVVAGGPVLLDSAFAPTGGGSSSLLVPGLALVAAGAATWFFFFRS